MVEQSLGCQFPLFCKLLCCLLGHIELLNELGGGGKGGEGEEEGWKGGGEGEERERRYGWGRSKKGRRGRREREREREEWEEGRRGKGGEMDGGMNKRVIRTGERRESGFKGSLPNCCWLVAPLCFSKHQLHYTKHPESRQQMHHQQDKMELPAQTRSQQG